MKKEMKKLLMAKISRNIATPSESAQSVEAESPMSAEVVSGGSVAGLLVEKPVGVEPPPGGPIAEIPVAVPPVVPMQNFANLARPSAKMRSFTGKQAAFWLNDEDRAIFNELVMLLRSQGVKASENLVLRAALRMVPKDYRLVEKIRELMQNDGRKLRHAGGQAAGN